MAVAVGKYHAVAIGERELLHFSGIQLGSTEVQPSDRFLAVQRQIRIWREKSRKEKEKGMPTCSVHKFNRFSTGREPGGNKV